MELPTHANAKKKEKQVNREIHKIFSMIQFNISNPSPESELSVVLDFKALSNQLDTIVEKTRKKQKSNVDPQYENELLQSRKRLRAIFHIHKN